jgi:hypothetical protein
MDFRPNRNKLIVSLIVLIIVTVIGSYYISNFCVTTTEAILCTDDYCPPYENPCSMWQPAMLSITGIFFGIPGFVIAYIVLSLAEKKKITR